MHNGYHQPVVERHGYPHMHATEAAHFAVNEPSVEVGDVAERASHPGDHHVVERGLGRLVRRQRSQLFPQGQSGTHVNR